jgi:hypothetical protein
MRANARLKPSVLWAGVLLGALLAASPPALAEHEGDDLRIVTLSTRPDAVSGGDVLVEVKLPRGTAPRDVEITLNRREITRAFQLDKARHALVGLVTGLELGKNVLRARVEEKRHHRHGGHDQEAKLELKNHPSFGPVFSGPRQTPWICETAASGLGEPPATGPCQVPSRYEWFYKSSDGTFKPLPGMSPPYPPDLVQTTTIDGRTVDFIVRVESGTINESIYRIAIIDDPTNPVANPWSAGGKRPGPGWNGKLFYHFLGGAGPGFRSGRNVVTSALNISDTVSTRDEPLRLGYAVAFGTRNTFGTGANDIISAETVMMIKERFIEQYGLPRYTVGLGSSGGAMQQHLIAHAYPGLLDAITPVRSYPDIVTVVTDVIDCGLLNNFWDVIANPADWPATKRSKVDGFPIDPMGRTNCVGWNAFARDWPGPTNGFDAVVPLAARYDPVSNRTGARGTFQDGLVNAFGIDPETGFARQPYDNIGVQYGLLALNGGDITKEEFLDLNERVGGLDIDGNFVRDRSEGDLKAIRNAYRTGRVNDGENLTLPMIQYRNYVDFANDIHTFHRSFQLIERLTKKNGTTANLVRWTMPQAGTVNFMRMALLAHDEWQRNIAADRSGGSYQAKVIRNKPSSLRNACWDDAGVMHEQPASPSAPGICNSLYPVHADVRIAAGGPRAGDILKCRLKPIDFGDYKVSFAPAERLRLAAIFPKGVCDWSRSGVNQQPQKDEWLSYPEPGRSARMDRGDKEDDRR